MPRYFFNIYHERNDFDDVGEDLPDRNVAWRLAIRTAGQLLQDIDGRLPPGKEWRMEVTDESRKAIYLILVSTKTL
jgi:uncharacterized protein DUF6894